MRRLAIACLLVVGCRRRATSLGTAGTCDASLASLHLSDARVVSAERVASRVAPRTAACAAKRDADTGLTHQLRGVGPRRGGVERQARRHRERRLQPRAEHRRHDVCAAAGLRGRRRRHRAPNGDPNDLTFVVGHPERIVTGERAHPRDRRSRKAVVRGGRARAEPSVLLRLLHRRASGVRRAAALPGRLRRRDRRRAGERPRAAQRRLPLAVPVEPRACRRLDDRHPREQAADDHRRRRARVRRAGRPDRRRGGRPACVRLRPRHARVPRRRRARLPNGAPARRPGAHVRRRAQSAHQGAALSRVAAGERGGLAGVLGRTEPARVDFWRYWVFQDSIWSPRTFDFDRDVARADSTAGRAMDQTSATSTRSRGAAARPSSITGGRIRGERVQHGRVLRARARAGGLEEKTDRFFRPVHGAGDGPLRGRHRCDELRQRGRGAAGDRRGP